MNPEQLRELANRLTMHASTYGAHPDDLCLRNDAQRAAAYLREQADRQEQSTPIGWIEGPHGALRANPDYRFRGPQAAAWSFPLYLHLAPQSAPAGYWLAPMEPTEAMQWDGRKARDNALGCKDDGIEGDPSNVMLQVYRAMRDAYIATSPAAPVEGVCGAYVDEHSDEDVIHHDGDFDDTAPAPADVVEALRELVAVKTMPFTEIREWESYTDRYAKAWRGAVAALAAADQKEPKCD